ncbi:hypothetical protein JCM5353_007323 [Sporobolomyces roseus]
MSISSGHLSNQFQLRSPSNKNAGGVSLNMQGETGPFKSSFVRTRKGKLIIWETETDESAAETVVSITQQEERKSSTESAPLYQSPSSQQSLNSTPSPTQPIPIASPPAGSPQTRNERRPSVQPPSWSGEALVPVLSQFSFPSSSPASTTRSPPPPPPLASPQSPVSLRQRHNVTFSLPPVEGSPQPERGARLSADPAISASLDSSDSLFSTPAPEPPAPVTRVLIPSNRRGIAKAPQDRQTGPVAPTSVVRWAVDNEKEYELSKSVGKDIFEDALQDETLIKEFQEYFAAHSGDASLLNLYIDLRSFSAQSAKLRSTASSILSTYFNEYSPSRLQLPISLRGPIIHSLTPLSSTLLSLETAEQDLFTRIHHDHFEGFTQERLVGMGVNWLSQKKTPAMKEGQEEVDWSKRGLGEAFCLTNPRLWDNPMILVSDGFAKLTGYATDEIVGLNCRVFQGPCTAQASYSVIREAVYGEKPITKLVLNYRRNGEPFYNLIQIIPIKNLIGEVQFFLGGVSDVTDLLHPFSTKAPSRGSAENAAPDRFYTRVLLARPASRKIVYATPEVSTFLGFSSSTSLLGLDLLNLLSPPSTTSPFLEGATPSETAPKETVNVQQAIAAAIRRGDTWRGPVEMDCRGEEEEEVHSMGPGIASAGGQRTTTCVLHLSPLMNEDGKAKMLVVM